MGLSYSVMSVLSSLSADEKVVEKFPDGRTVTTNRKNPVVATVIGGSSAILLIMLVDGGDGMLTKILGKRCIDCSQKILTSA